jgi:putative ABC transport system substrate-binding protein
MRRRALCLTGLWAARAWPAWALARLPLVVMILTGNADATRSAREHFIDGMRHAGQVEGRTYSLQVRLGDGEPARAEQLLKQAVAEAPQVLVVAGLIQARQARDLTATIPVVVATGGDLVDAGVVASLARPGGNITGVSDLADEATVKRLELTKAALPKATRVALLSNPDFPATRKVEARVEAAAPRLGLEVTRVQVSDRTALARAIDSLNPARTDALLVVGDALLTANRAEVIERALALRVPVVFYWPGTAELGALFSLQPDVNDNFRRAAGYVDKILKGTKPGDLPIYQPTRYELVVNLRVARTLGIVLPRSFLLRADKVIE